MLLPRLRIAAVGSGAPGAAGTAPTAPGMPDDDSAPDAAARRRAGPAQHGCLLSMMVLFVLLLVRPPPPSPPASRCRRQGRPRVAVCDPADACRGGVCGARAATEACIVSVCVMLLCRRCSRSQPPRISWRPLFRGTRLCARRITARTRQWHLWYVAQQGKRRHAKLQHVATRRRSQTPRGMHARLQVLRLNTTQQVAAQRDSTLPRNETLHPGGNGRDVAPEASERTSEASARSARTSKRSDGAQRIAKTRFSNTDRFVFVAGLEGTGHHLIGEAFATAVEGAESPAKDSTTLRCLHPMHSRARRDVLSGDTGAVAMLLSLGGARARARSPSLPLCLPLSLCISVSVSVSVGRLSWAHTCAQ